MVLFEEIFISILTHFQFYSGLKAGDEHFHLLQNTVHNTTRAPIQHTIMRK